MMNHIPAVAKKKPGRPPKAAEWHTMTLRLEPETVETLDRLVDQVYQKQGLNVTHVGFPGQGFPPRNLSISRGITC
jgi:hypothetical protein